MIGLQKLNVKEIGWNTWAEDKKENLFSHWIKQVFIGFHWASDFPTKAYKSTIDVNLFLNSDKSWVCFSKKRECSFMKEKKRRILWASSFFYFEKTRYRLKVVGSCERKTRDGCILLLRTPRTHVASLPTMDKNWLHSYGSYSSKENVIRT